MTERWPADPSWDELTGREPEEPPVIAPRASLEAPGPSPGELARLRADALLAIERNTRRAKELEEAAEVLGKARNLLSVLILKGLDVAAEQIPRLLERYSGDTGRAAAELARSGLVELDRIRRKDPQGQGL